MKSLTIIFALLFSFASLSVAQTTPSPDAQKLYKSKCNRCHGKTGDKGLFRAPKLSQSTVSDASVILLIQEGKGVMPSFKKFLTDQEMQSLLAYIKTFRG